MNGKLTFRSKTATLKSEYGSPLHTMEVLLVKRFVIILFCILLLLSFCGCEAEPQAPTVPTVPKPEDPLPAFVIDTKYYTLAIPQKWADSCAYEIFETDNGLDVLSLYEATAFEEFGGGKLCSIQLMPTGDDTYKEFPNYEWIGELDTPDGRFNMIVLFPSDVQFTQDTMQVYNEMFDQLHDVLYALSPKAGIEMARPAPTI